MIRLELQFLNDLFDFLRVRSLMYSSLLFKYCETVLFDTPAAFATSSIVTFFGCFMHTPPFIRLKLLTLSVDESILPVHRELYIHKYTV